MPTLQLKILHDVKFLFFLFLFCWLLPGCSRFGEDNAPAPASLAPIKSQVSFEKNWSDEISSDSLKQRVRLALAEEGGTLFVAEAGGFIQARDGSTGRLFWQQDLKQFITAGVAVSQGLVAVVTRQPALVVLSAKTGQILWQAELSNQALAVPVILQEGILVKTIDEQVLFFDAKTQGLYWNFATQAPNLLLRFGSSPAVSEDRIVVASNTGHVFGVNRQKGTLIWEKAIARPDGATEAQQMVDMDVTPLIEKDRIYVASYQGNLAALELSQGNPVWQQPFSSFTGLALSGDLLYATDQTGQVWAFDKQTGQIKWKNTALLNRALTAPVILHDWLIVGDGLGYLQILSAQTGALIGYFAVSQENDPILSTPLVRENRIVVLTQKGHLISYHLDSLS